MQTFKSSFRRSWQSSQTFVTQVRHSSDAVDCALSDSITEQFKTNRANERKEMQHLNNRFATYIANVLYLEQQNKALLAEVERLNVKGKSCVGDLYEKEMTELRSEVEQLTKEKKRAELEQENLRDDLSLLRETHQSEILRREKAENTVKEIRLDIDYAEQIRSDMETEKESLKQEITFLKKLHSKEIEELRAQIKKQHVQIDMDMVNPDLTAALRDVRLQYEMLATKHIQESEELYRSKLVSMYESVTLDNEALRKARQEVHDYRRQVQTLSCEVSALKETIKKMEDSHSTEVADYEDIIMKLKSNIHGMTSEISHHVLKYQDLLEVKMALDIEITAYRKLLEGGESRITATTNSTLNLDLIDKTPINKGSDPESDGDATNGYPMCGLD